MSKIYIEKLDIKAANLNGESSLPMLYDIEPPSRPTDLDVDESDGLFANYRIVKTAFPYKSQDMYTRKTEIDGVDGVVLENDHLKASFIPSLGGKLWSLFDKDNDKELLFANPVFRPAYLALRNAWSSGGIEWNCGAFTGHHPHTCSKMFACVIDEEESGVGCPVLRMYNYERIRNVTYQMDFYLPDGSRFLHCRMRVVNDSLTSTDMYWWSNIAVRYEYSHRCVVPADFAFTPVKGKISRIPIPFYNGRDVSYPANSPFAIDYFYKTYEGRHYTSCLDKNGYGLVQTSTSILKGRKLFVWGQGQGGEKWQEYLSGSYGDGKYCDGKYCEIQCGLANTQYECIPMPPKTAWEWIEYYGSVKADAKKIHGDWHEAQKELEARLDALINVEDAEAELKATHKMAVTKAGKMISCGEGWAALENKRHEKEGMRTMSPHLDFGDTGSEQEIWLSLLENGTVGDVSDADISKLTYQRGSEWMKLLRLASESKDAYNWLTHYQLGCSYLAEGMTGEAEKSLKTAVGLRKNAFVLYAYAETLRVKGDIEGYVLNMKRAAELDKTDVSLCKMTAKALADCKKWIDLKEYAESLDERMKREPRIRFYTALAHVKTGDFIRAEELLYEDGGLEIPDIKEGETSITELWFGIQEQKAEQNGEAFDRNAAKPPKQFDFRMKS